MAYYTGQCTDFQHLADILVEKCQGHGWTWQDGILSKDDLFIKIIAKNQPAQRYFDPLQQGISITGGNGKQGTQLINPSETSVRLGCTAFGNQQRYFPAVYHLFIFADEVYLVMKFDIDKFYYLAFGKSNILQNTQGNGLWLSATACFYPHYLNDRNEYISISTSNGGSGGGNSTSAVAPFWNRNAWNHQWSNSVICHGLDGSLWSSGSSIVHCTFEPLISRMPSVNFADSLLLPYDIFLLRPERKISLIAQFKYARFVRIDHYEPEQIITLGHEKWIVFPFFQKNVQQRDNGWIDHTGTFGWAIRYEG